MIQIHAVDLGVVVALLLGLALAVRVGTTRSAYDFVSPVIGCVVLLLSIVISLLLLLAHAWGWV